MRARVCLGLARDGGVQPRAEPFRNMTLVLQAGYHQGVFPALHQAGDLRFQENIKEET
jgi:hypothetical protein